MQLGEKKKKRANLFSGQLPGLRKKRNVIFIKRRIRNLIVCLICNKDKVVIFLGPLLLQKNLQFSKQSITTNSYKNQTQTTEHIFIVLITTTLLLLLVPSALVHTSRSNPVRIRTLGRTELAVV